MTDPFPTDISAAARLRSGTAARLSGVPVATLRVWERRYGVVAAPKTATGQRLYSGHDVQRLRLIKQLTERGHAIGTIAALALPALEALAAGELMATAPLAAVTTTRRVWVVGRVAAQKLQAAGVTPLRAWQDLDEADAGRMISAARRLAAALRRSGLPCEGVNLLLADGVAAGQTVFHCHLHVIPRTSKDGFGFRRPLGIGRDASRLARESVAERVRACLDA